MAGENDRDKRDHGFQAFQILETLDAHAELTETLELAIEWYIANAPGITAEQWYAIRSEARRIQLHASEMMRVITERINELER